MDFLFRDRPPVPTRGLLRDISMPDLHMGQSISRRFDDGDRAIENGSRLLVVESQLAVMVYCGVFADVFGPGVHKLTTDNIPLLTSLASWKYGFNSPFKADVYFVSTKVFAGSLWGTPHPVMVLDPKLGPVRIRAHGTYDFRVTDPKVFLANVAGSDHDFTLEEVEPFLRSRVISSVSEVLAASDLPVAALAARFGDLGRAVLTTINPALSSRFGLELSALVFEGVSLPDELGDAVDAAATATLLSSVPLDRYLQIQMARSLTLPGATTALPGQALLGLALARQTLGLESVMPPAPPALPSPPVEPLP